MTDLALTTWIDRGTEVPGLTLNPFSNLDMPFRYYALVQITRATSGTTIRWDPAHAHDSSIELALQQIPTCPAPYTLEYYKEGWFTERYGTVQAAIEKIEAVQHMRDVPVLRKFFSQSKPLDTCTPLYRHAMQEPERFQDLLVYADIDDEAIFPIVEVGKHSLLANVMGHDWLEEGTFNVEGGDREMAYSLTRSYVPIIETGTPHLDDMLCQIYPDSDEPRWLYCQRLIWPTKTDDGRYSMAALCTKLSDPRDLFAIKSH
ncbi:MAG: hypothetical protein ACR2PM_14025 [Hyphomicrobiales bacterium]